MTAKEKYTEIIKEIIRNEAVTDDKLNVLVKKFKTSKKNTAYYLRKSGVIEPLGDGVNRVLIRDKGIEPYVNKIVALATPYRQQKSEPLDMSLPGKWHDEDPNTRACTKPYFDDNGKIAYEEAEPYTEIPDDQLEQAGEAIDIHAKFLDMLNSLDTKIINQNAQIFAVKNQIKTFMGQVQTNTNKQNEYIGELAANIDEMQRKAPYQRIAELEEDVTGFRNEMPEIYNRLENRIAKLESFVDDIDHTELIEDPVITLKGKIEELENTIKEERNVLISNVRRLNDRIVNLEEKTPIDNNKGMLKALHQLLGELI